jgi:hypothetical protein
MTFGKPNVEGNVKPNIQWYLVIEGTWEEPTNGFLCATHHAFYIHICIIHAHWLH